MAVYWVQLRAVYLTRLWAPCWVQLSAGGCISSKVEVFLMIAVVGFLLGKRRGSLPGAVVACLLVTLT